MTFFFCKILITIGFVICSIGYVNSTCYFDKPVQTFYGIISESWCSQICFERQNKGREISCSGYLYHGKAWKCECFTDKEDYETTAHKSGKCDPNPCENNGTCMTSDDTSRYTCLCQKEYQGERCQDMCQMCGDEVCLNGGTCLYKGPNCKGSCQCPFPYYGKACKESRCPEGFTYLYSSRSCFKLHPKKLNWDDANRQCAKYNPYGRLFFITSKQVSDELYARIDEQNRGYLDTTIDDSAIEGEVSKRMWLGGRRKSDDCSLPYLWMDGKFNAEIKYFDWRTDSAGKPTDPNCYNDYEKCLVLLKSQFNDSLVWIDSNCLILMTPLCEIPL